MNNKLFWVIGAIVLGFIFFNAKPQSGICIQVVTPACNPITNIIQDFPTPCDIPSDWTRDLNQCSQDTSIKRKITILSDKVEIKLLILGQSKFGGIIKEVIPAGLQVQGISNTNLGVGGSATGKLTNNVYEVVFVSDNVAEPSITYALTKPESNLGYSLSGNFEFANGYQNGCIPNDDFGVQQQEVINLCKQYINEQDCSRSYGAETQGEFCKWVSMQGMIGGEKQIFQCLKKCLRPQNLCQPASDVSDACGSVCTGLWDTLKRSDADVNCDNFVDNQELLDGIRDWVSDKPPFNSNTILLKVISGWVKSTPACVKNAHSVWFCQGEPIAIALPETIGG